MADESQLGNLSVEIRAKLDQFQRDLADAQQQTTQAASGMQASLAGIQRSVDALGAGAGNLKGLSDAFALGELKARAFEEGLRLAGEGLRAIVELTKSAIDAAAEHQTQVVRLNAALRGQGEFSSQLSGELVELAEKYERLTALQHDQIIAAERILVQFGATRTEIGQLLPAVLDLSTRFGSVDQAAQAVGRALVGQETILKRAGVAVDQHATREQRAADIAKGVEAVYAGQAQALGATYTGALERAGNAWTFLSEKLGAAITDNDAVLQTIRLVANELFGLGDQATAAGAKLDHLVTEGVLALLDAMPRVAPIAIEIGATIFELGKAFGELTLDIVKNAGALLDWASTAKLIADIGIGAGIGAANPALVAFSVAARAAAGGAESLREKLQQIQPAIAADVAALQDGEQAFLANVAATAQSIRANDEFNASLAALGADARTAFDALKTGAGSVDLKRFLQTAEAQRFAQALTDAAKAHTPVTLANQALARQLGIYALVTENAGQGTRNLGNTNDALAKAIEKTRLEMEAENAATKAEIAIREAAIQTGETTEETDLKIALAKKEAKAAVEGTYAANKALFDQEAKEIPQKAAAIVQTKLLTAAQVEYRRLIQQGQQAGGELAALQQLNDADTTLLGIEKALFVQKAAALGQSDAERAKIAAVAAATFDQAHAVAALTEADKAHITAGLDLQDLQKQLAIYQAEGAGLLSQLDTQKALAAVEIDREVAEGKISADKRDELVQDQALVAAAKERLDFAKQLADLGPSLTSTLTGAASDSLNAFQNFFLNVENKGKNTWKQLGDDLLTAFKKALAEMAVLALVKPIVVPVFEALGGVLGIGGGGGGGFGSVLGLLGAGAPLINSIAGLTGSNESLIASNQGVGSGLFSLGGQVVKLGGNLTGLSGAIQGYTSSIIGTSPANLPAGFVGPTSPGSGVLGFLGNAFPNAGVLPGGSIGGATGGFIGANFLGGGVAGGFGGGAIGGVTGAGIGFLSGGPLGALGGGIIGALQGGAGGAALKPGSVSSLAIDAAIDALTVVTVALTETVIGAVIAAVLLAVAEIIKVFGFQPPTQGTIERKAFKKFLGVNGADVFGGPVDERAGIAGAQAFANANGGDYQAGLQHMVDLEQQSLGLGDKQIAQAKDLGVIFQTLLGPDAFKGGPHALALTQEFLANAKAYGLDATQTFEAMGKAADKIGGNAAFDALGKAVAASKITFQQATDAAAGFTELLFRNAPAGVHADKIALDEINATGQITADTFLKIKAAVQTATDAANTALPVFNNLVSALVANPDQFFKTNAAGVVSFEIDPQSLRSLHDQVVKAFRDAAIKGLDDAIIKVAFDASVLSPLQGAITSAIQGYTGGTLTLDQAQGQITDAIGNAKDQFNALTPIFQLLITSSRQLSDAFATLYDTATGTTGGAAGSAGTAEGFNLGIQQQIAALEADAADPTGLTAKFQALNQAEKDRLDAAKAAGADLVQVEKLNALERAKAIKDAQQSDTDQLKQLADQRQQIFDKQLQAAQQALQSIQDAITQATASTSSPLAPRVAEQNAQQVFDALTAKAKAGDLTAAQQLPKAFQDLTATAQAAFAHGPEFASIFNAALATMQQILGDGAGALTTLSPGDQKIVDQIDAQTATLHADLQRIATLGAPPGTPGSAGYTTVGGFGLTPSVQASLLTTIAGLTPGGATEQALQSFLSAKSLATLQQLDPTSFPGKLFKALQDAFPGAQTLGDYQALASAIIAKIHDPATFQPLLGFAAGGIVTGATVAQVGEAGPEAVLPLSGFATILEGAFTRALVAAGGTTRAGAASALTGGVHILTRNPDGSVTGPDGTVIRPKDVGGTFNQQVIWEQVLSRAQNYGARKSEVQDLYAQYKTIDAATIGNPSERRAERTAAYADFRDAMHDQQAAFHATLGAEAKAAYQQFGWRAFDGPSGNYTFAGGSNAPATAADLAGQRWAAWIAASANGTGIKASRPFGETVPPGFVWSPTGGVVPAFVGSRTGYPGIGDTPPGFNLPPPRAYSAPRLPSLDVALPGPSRAELAAGSGRSGGDLVAKEHVRQTMLTNQALGRIEERLAALERHAGHSVREQRLQGAADHRGTHRP